MSQSPTTHVLPALPITVDVSDSGAVTVETPTRLVAMSRFSERAQRLTLWFGRGETFIRSDADVTAIPDAILFDIAEALS